MRDEQSEARPKWPIYVGIFVALGSVATVALAFIESWWG
jgi:hypothetical protein